jgi:murein DD-endopeptidase MepM/ murein hydrolase activator NlpD
MKKKIKIGILIAVIVAALLIVFFQIKRIMEAAPEVPAIVEIPEPVLMYGLPVDSFQIESGTVRPGQNLSDILLSKGIPMTTIDQIAKNSVLVFDARKIKVRNDYHFFLKNDSTLTPQYLVYEINPIEYVVYQLTDSLKVTKGVKPVKTEIKTASGEIKSSLWNCMTDQGLSPMLAIQLSEIYAWTIDFFGIQKGDHFQVIYEENSVDGVPVGLGKIFAANFNHANEDYYAFLFLQDNEESYFDDKGKSLKKAFLKAPLKFSRISSYFTNDRYHPVLKIHRPHHGIDYAAPSGTPVFTIGDGIVIAKGYQAAGGGNFLKIKHNSVYTTSYMHLKGFAPGIKTGSHVRQGELIGYVGATGLATGPHLDFRVFQGGTPVDPLKIKAPPVEPVHDQNMAAFTALRDSLTTQLQKIPILK